MSLSRLSLPLTVVLLLLLGGCASNSDKQTDSGATQVDIARAMRDFQARPELAKYFEQAEAVIILPHNLRAGTGFGGAVGKGWLVERGSVTAGVWHWQFFAGADLGFQFYQQILFLKDAEALSAFKAWPLQFAGQVNATALLWGTGLTPSYNDGVALFTIIDGGLLLEGSVGMHSYHFRP